MDVNNLVVTVCSARGLCLKGHSKLDAFVSLTINGRGTWRSKVQTEVMRTANDCTWNQRCEFALNDLESNLMVSVNHRTVIGTSDCIGALELCLRDLIQVGMPTWYRLRKKGSSSQADEANSKKYRGELMLKFEFSRKLGVCANQKLSASTYSMNTVHGSSKLDTLKRKIHIGKKKNKLGDNSSVISLQQQQQQQYAGQHRSSFSDIYSPNQLNGTAQTASTFNNDGLITPPVISCATPVRNLKSTASKRPNDDAPSTGHSRNSSLSVASVRNWLKSSAHQALDEHDFFETSSPVLARPRSVASSGFGSARSTLINPNELASLSSSCLSREDLLKIVTDLRMELAGRDAKIYDLHDYIDRLLVRIMDNDPEILESIGQLRGGGGGYNKR